MRLTLIFQTQSLEAQDNLKPGCLSLCPETPILLPRNTNILAGAPSEPEGQRPKMPFSNMSALD